MKPYLNPKKWLKNKKLRMPYLIIIRGDHRKTIQVIKVLDVNCAPVTGITKGNRNRS